jgi:hypothetical protein
MPWLQAQSQDTGTNHHLARRSRADASHAPTVTERRMKEMI